MNKTIFRVTITHHGIKRSLLSLGSSHRGDVYITLRRGELFRDHRHTRHEVGVSSRHNRKIVETRISIHPSPESPTSNAVKFQIKTIGENDPATLYRRTKALKSSSGFCFLFWSRRSAGPGPHNTAPIDNVSSISLGEYDPDIFTLFYFVIASQKETHFEMNESDEIGLRDWTIGSIRFTLLYSYIFAPSHDAGMTGFYEQRNAGGLAEEEDGMNENGVMEMFAHFRAVSFTDLLTIYSKEKDGAEAVALLLSIAKCFKDPNSEAAKDYRIMLGEKFP